MTTGLLLGAGASFECGMPLVWEITNQIRGVFTPEVVRSCNDRSKALSLDYPDHTIDAFLKIIEMECMHYESMIGNLQTLTRRAGGGRGDGIHYDALSCWILEIVYMILDRRHSDLAGVIKAQMRFLDGIVGLANRNKPLWILNLNHDLIVECISAHNKIKINHGFPDTMSIPLPGKSKGRLNAIVLKNKTLSTQGLPYFQPGTEGINLLKVHGSLDIFKFNDENDYLKFEPIEQSFDGVLRTLDIVNNTLPYKDPRNPNLRISNEIMYEDDNGEVQYLKKSILSGAFKFREAPLRAGTYNMLSHFKTGLLYINKLMVIGYGFGDAHVNNALRDWLELNGDKHLEIVDPFRTAIPSELLHVAPQITLHQMNASEFLEQFSPTPLSAFEKNVKKHLLAARKSIGTALSKKA